MKIQKKNWGGEGGSGRVGWGGGLGLVVQGGCEWRGEAFVKIQKNIEGVGVGAWVRGGVGLGGVRVDGNREVKLV